MPWKLQRKLPPEQASRFVPRAKIMCMEPSETHYARRLSSLLFHAEGATMRMKKKFCACHDLRIRGLRLINNMVYKEDAASAVV